MTDDACRASGDRCVHRPTVAWAYASIMDLASRCEAVRRPLSPSLIRCRYPCGQGAPVGVGLLSARRASRSSSPQVRLGDRTEPDGRLARAPRPAERGRLVVHTWDVPEAARVRIDDSVVWYSVVRYYLCFGGDHDATRQRMDLVVVTGAGGFIGGHLVGELRRLGYRRLRAVDVKPVDEWYQVFPDVDNRELDLRERAAC